MRETTLKDTYYKFDNLEVITQFGNVTAGEKAIRFK